MQPRLRRLLPCASPKAYSGLTNRVHTFRVRAVDRAGNVDPAPSARTWTVDTTLPAIASPSPAPSSATQDRTPTVRATVRDTQTDLAKTGVQLYVDGIRRTTFSYDRATDRLSYTPATNLSYARHTAKVVARDAAGNTTTKSWSFGVTR
ncbi:hypothetical protein GBA65_03440 [Rubrobacter marinus]|uniref:Uncharacterized protein n=1 Tax=Rubrobacter marinus TaxID=2653852 RepID=A0A6G8PTR7_9ACTN|nr:Ig-like domain-containing protein [Rubrobacter marinus]QIN77723.1 hypothetical protein GBA65_03440 [Rubrobacter marinus]